MPRFTLCHRQTIDLPDIVRGADIVCVAAGHPGLINGDMVKPGATVLDFGVNVTDGGAIVGDADFDSILELLARSLRCREGRAR
jgi:methylenetetrahydrofolate dehydrogenase (NADP+)/methenyltetrahydrofolate cyclohydrolase